MVHRHVNHTPSFLAMRSTLARTFSRSSPRKPSSSPPDIFNLGGNADLARHVFMHARILSLSSHAVTLSHGFPEDDIVADGVLRIDYAVCAVVAHPHDVAPPTEGREEEAKDQDREEKAYGGTKPEGIAWLKRAGAQRTLMRPHAEIATDIGALHPAICVTLLHSGARLLPMFDEGLHGEARTARRTRACAAFVDAQGAGTSLRIARLHVA
ncbi:hypothetical protein FB451DRAFT_1555645 [Mycena latifolia]|nr:hypothetical protein FB451DRAFT_1555645 [Mycena latifolia]